MFLTLIFFDWYNLRGSLYLTLPFSYLNTIMNNDTHPPKGADQPPTAPGSNIWGPKFPLFGLAVILLFAILVGARACYLGIPLGDVFKNADPAPTSVDSTSTSQ